MSIRSKIRSNKVVRLFGRIVLKWLNFPSRLYVALIIGIQNYFLRGVFFFFSHTKINPKQSILILRSHYRPGSKEKTERELSTEYYNLTLTLEESRLIQFDEYFYDLHYQKKLFPFGDLQLLKKCVFGKYKAIILSSFNDVGLGYPKKEVLVYISRKLGIPIFTIWWDSAGEELATKLKEYERFTYCNVFMDKKQDALISGNKIINMGFTPQAISLFNPYNNVRDIDVAFLGSVNSYRSNRLPYIRAINELAKSGFKCMVGGGTSDQRLTMEEYASIFRRSKIVVNFSMSVGDQHQCKGRVTEAIRSGALLLESENDETARKFVRYRDYIPFQSPEDLHEKLKHYLSNDAERLDITSQAYVTCQSCCTGDIFWKKILKEL